MPPDTQADGPGGPKARRTRGPASPGQRTAQPFGGTLNASPLRCAPGASAFRGRSATHAGRRTRGASVLAAPAGLPQAAAHAGHRPPAGIPRPMQAAAHAGHRSSQPPQASRRSPPRAGHRPPAGVPRPTQVAARAAPRSSQAPVGLPQAAARAGPRSSQAPAGVPRPPAARRTHRASVPRGRSAARQAFRSLPPPTRGLAARPHPPAARFSRRPPCGIGPRMVYCT